tara:strand:- start:549 stop:776 length:228 start_codon:yes stop_codon:yes gene_type:complete
VPTIGNFKILVYNRMSTIIIPGGAGGMGFGLVSQAVNLGILYVLFIIGKYAYTQYFVNKRPIRVADILRKFNILI